MTLLLRELIVRRGHFRLGPISASAAPGRIVALLGGNGSGKSTLLGALAGSVRIDEGQAHWMALDLRRAPPRERAKCVAFVPQRPVLDAAFTVRESVELGRYALPRDPARVDAAIRACGLERLGWRPWHALSEGQRQRVALARAIAQHRPGGLLLLDEPFAAMDPASVRASLDVVREQARCGGTVLLATHDLTLAGFADDAWLLRDGALVAAGEVSRVLVPEVLASIYGVEFFLVEGAAPRAVPLPRWTSESSPLA